MFYGPKAVCCWASRMSDIVVLSADEEGDLEHRYDWNEPWSVVIWVGSQAVNVPLRGITNIQLARSYKIERFNRSSWRIENGWFLLIEYTEEGVAKSLRVTTADKDTYRQLKAFMTDLVCYM